LKDIDVEMTAKRFQFPEDVH